MTSCKAQPGNTTGSILLGCDDAGAPRHAKASGQSAYTVEWQTIDIVQTGQAAAGSAAIPHGSRAIVLQTFSTGSGPASLRLSAKLPPLRASISSLAYLQQVVLPAPAAGRTLQLTARQAPAAFSGPGAAAGSSSAAAADGIWGLLRVAAAELLGLSVQAATMDGSSRLLTSAGGQYSSDTAHVPSYADGHGATASAGSWSAPRLLPASARTVAGQTSPPGMQSPGEHANTSYDVKCA